MAIRTCFTDAVRLHQAGRRSEAEQAYIAILQGDASHFGALHLLGVIRHQGGDHHAAIDLIGRAIARCPANASFHSNYGLALLALGRWRKARDSLLRALELSPRYVQAMANLAMALDALGQTDEAMARLREGLAIDPQHIDARIKLATLLERLGRFNEAAAVYEDGIALEPCIEYYVNLGGLRIVSGRANLAVDPLRNAIELDPNSAAAHFSLGLALQELALSDPARHEFAVAARLCPKKSFWGLRMLSCSPAVFENRAEIDCFRRTVADGLKAWRGPVAADWSDLLEAGALPGIAFSYQGHETRGLKEQFAAIYEPYFRGRRRGSGSGLDRRRIGLVVTRRHEGLFLRCMQGILDRLDADRFEIVVPPYAAHQGHHHRALLAPGHALALPQRIEKFSWPSTISLPSTGATYGRRTPSSPHSPPCGYEPNEPRAADHVQLAWQWSTS